MSVNERKIIRRGIIVVAFLAGLTAMALSINIATATTIFFVTIAVGLVFVFTYLVETRDRRIHPAVLLLAILYFLALAALAGLSQFIH